MGNGRYSTICTCDCGEVAGRSLSNLTVRYYSYKSRYGKFNIVESESVKGCRIRTTGPCNHLSIYCAPQLFALHSSPATLLLTECQGALHQDYPSNLPLEVIHRQCSLPSTQGAISNFSKCHLDIPLRDLRPLVVLQPPTLDR